VLHFSFGRRSNLNSSAGIDGAGERVVRANIETVFSDHIVLDHRTALNALDPAAYGSPALAGT